MSAAPLGTSQKAARFTQVRLLGEGASGRVFEVFDSVHQARCALKELRRDRALDPARIGRFKDEFRALTTISHPNLVQVYELLVDGSDVRLLMELVEGVDFVSHVRQGDPSSVPSIATESGQGEGRAPAVRGGKLSVERLRPALAQLAGGVLALHAAGKVHCDLKPENVLVTAAGRVVIVDFGLLSNRERVPNARLRGTPPYVSPEQEDGLFSEAGDWYAFGVILYLALTGRLPFQGSGQALAYEKRFGRPIDPRRIAQDVPDDLSDLALGLLAPDAARRTSAEVVARTTRLDDPPLPSFASSGRETFVGRSNEIARLQRAFDQVTNGETRVVHVHGESGIGKTRLVGHVLHALECSAASPVVLRSVCHADASVPYRGLDAIMDRLAADLSRRVPAFEAERLAPLTTMFPVFGEVTAEYAALRETQPATARQRAVEGLRVLFAELAARGPVVLHIDDFQRADAETVDVLAELVRPPTRGLLVVLSYRTTGGPAAETILAARKALPCDDDVALDVLSEKDARALARALVPWGSSDAALEAIVSGARGNPFFARQLALVRGEGSEDRASLEAVLAARLSNLSAGQREYLELSAVAGHPLDERVLVRALDASGAEVLAARRHLLAECFVRHADSRDGAVEPYHDQVREAVLHVMPAATRRHRHARLAEALEVGDYAEPEALAFHFRGAGDVAKALHYTELAADAAARFLAFDHAANLYGGAVALTAAADRDRVEQKLARALSAAGRSEEAAATFLALASRSPGDLEFHLHAGDELLRAGHVDRGLAILRQIARAIGEPFPSNELVAKAAVLVHGWRLRSVAVPKASSTETVTATERHQLALCHTIAKQLSMVDPLRSVLFQRRYLRLALRVASVVDVGKGLAIEASVSAHMSTRLGGGPARAADLVAKCREVADRTGDPEVRAGLYFATGQTAYALGRWKECRESLERALAFTRSDVVVGVRWDIALCQSFIAFMLWMEGDVIELRRRIGEYMAEAKTVRSLETITALRVGTMLALCADNVAGARRIAAEAMDRWPAAPWRLQHYFDAVARVEIELYDGRSQAAWELMCDLWIKTDASGLFTQEFFVASSLAQRARVAVAVGRRRDAEHDVRALEARPEGWARAFGTIVRAALDWSAGLTTRALVRLEQAFVDFRAADLGLYALAARWRLGSLRNQPAVIAEAAEGLAERGIREPGRMAEALVPWPSLPASKEP